LTPYTLSDNLRGSVKTTTDTGAEMNAPIFVITFFENMTLAPESLCNQELNLSQFEGALCWIKADRGHPGYAKTCFTVKWGEGMILEMREDVTWDSPWSVKAMLTQRLEGVKRIEDQWLRDRYNEIVPLWQSLLDTIS